MTREGRTARGADGCTRSRIMMMKTVRNKGVHKGPPKLEKHVTSLTCPSCRAEVAASTLAVQGHTRLKHRGMPVAERRALERLILPSIGETVKMNLLREAVARRSR
jgi:hypothetical protein